MTQDAFEREAGRYEAWYATRRGSRAEAAERGLLVWLLEPFAGSTRMLEVGCGTGHFTSSLARCGGVAIGLDRSRAMLREARRLSPGLPLVLGDAARLPFADRALDLVLYATTLEFVDDPARALREGVRIARRGVIVVALNRWSLGGLSRRVGRQRRSPILGRAKDGSARSLRGALAAAAGPRLVELRWASTLFPDGLSALRLRLPVGGDVVGVAATLRG
jgi:ubiquinone/menaquinone biosynthesis C-methylase UbiE